jgi:hypothetical protein
MTALCDVSRTQCQRKSASRDQTALLASVRVATARALPGLRLGQFDEIAVRVAQVERTNRSRCARPFDRPELDPNARRRERVGNLLERPLGTLEPIWNLFDLTPEGRPADWYEQLSY